MEKEQHSIFPIAWMISTPGDGPEMKWRERNKNEEHYIVSASWGLPQEV